MNKTAVGDLVAVNAGADSALGAENIFILPLSTPERGIPSQARRPATTTREVEPKTIPGLFHERSSNGHRAFVDRR
jgi:hypothetical protein